MAQLHVTSDGSNDALEVKVVATTAGAIYTNPASTTSHIKLIILHNSNTSAETVKIYAVPDSTGSLGAAGDNTNKIYQLSIDANQTLQLEFPGPGIVLADTNDSIQAVTDTANKVIATVTATQVT